MKARVLAIDETVVTHRSVEFLCYGLGPCVGLFIWDVRKGIFAGAHLAWQSKASQYCEHPILDNMLMQMKWYGSTLEALCAKMAGGATLLQLSSPVGELNASVIRQYLLNKHIHIIAQDTGGHHSRKVRFACDSESLQIKYCNNTTLTI